MKRRIITTSFLTFFLASPLLVSAGEIIGETYYGGKTDGSAHSGDIVNTLKDKELTTYVGGNSNLVNAGSAVGSVVGNIVNNLDNVTISSNFTAGNWANDSSGKPSSVGHIGIITNNISNSTILKKLFLGSLSSGPNAQWDFCSIAGVNSTITKSTITEVCLSGGAVASKIMGDVNVNLIDSNVNEIFHNGGTLIKGDLNLTLKNTNVLTNYFYLCPDRAYSWVGLEDTGIKGNVNLVLEGTTKIGTSKIITNINCGSTSFNNPIGGDLNVTLKDSAVVTGTIYARNANGNYPINGKATLNLGTSDAAYVADSLSVRDFDVINVAEGSSVNFATFSTANQGKVLNVKGVVSVTDGKIAVAEGGFLNLTIKENGQIKADVENAGTFSISATTDDAGKRFDIFSAGKGLSGNGEIKVYGGKLLEGNIFEVASASTAVLNANSKIAVSENGRVAVSVEESGEVVVDMAFNTQSATVNSVSETTQTLASQLGEQATSEFTAMGAYKFEVDMAETDSVVLSFIVDKAELDAKHFTIFHKGKGDTEWSEATDITGLSYDGKTLSFTVSHFSEYGFVAVPEPSTYAAVFGVLALAFALYRRRK